MANWVKVTTTADNREVLQRLAEKLIELRLGGCMQISGPVESHYVWEGRHETSVEYVLTIKTAAELFDRLCDNIHSHHPYQVPQIVATPISKISPAYESWLEGNITRQTPNQFP
ncbi:MAG: divalent-cation tolerance protein CutA [Pirellulaceae bacterium]|jgi:periplasmic divalent cation tolerance protein|nr:divalent-cation tolerance protein CutA [Pirellulaceae bacterium]